MRKTDEIFNGLAREQRLRIERAVREGRALADGQDGAVAVRRARQLLERGQATGWHRIPRAVAWIMTVVYPAVLLVQLLRRDLGAVPSWPTIILGFYLCTHAYFWLSWPRRRELIRQAERLNLQVAEAAGVPVETDRSTGLTPGQVSGGQV